MNDYGYISEYQRQIEDGRITAGKWIRLLYKRIIAGLDNGDFFYDAKMAQRAITFITNFCRHHEGPLAPGLITLELWQKALVSILFGVLDAEGLRQFREAFIVMARKNGKTLLAAAIAAYMTYCDGEYGARVYFTAPKLEQASLCYEAFYQMILKEPELSSLAKKRRSDIYFEDTNSSAKPLAFSEKRSDGLNIHLCVADEMSSWAALQGLKMYEVLKSSFGARKQPLLLSISTAGYVNDGPYDELMKRATAWLNGDGREMRLLPVLYIIDDATRWNDIEELKKSNPNLGVSIKPQYLLEEIAIAEQSLSKRAEFLTKYCNVKQSSTAAWLPYEVVDRVCGDQYRLEDFRGCYCVGGIDLSQTTDLTACSVVIEREGVLHTFTQFFMPANKIDELQEREGVPYRIYVQRGWITPSGENYVDYKDCFNWFRRLVKEYKILPLRVGYDRYSAQYLVNDMTAAGFKMSDVFQGWNLSPVILEADGLLRDGVLRLGDNNLLKAHFLNVALQQNAENRKYQPVKIEPRLHIDGFVSVIDALTVRQHDYEEIGPRLKNTGR